MQFGGAYPVAAWRPPLSEGLRWRLIGVSTYHQHQARRVLWLMRLHWLSVPCLAMRVYGCALRCDTSCQVVIDDGSRGRFGLRAYASNASRPSY